MEYHFHQNPKWTIRPCDLDTLTRFCPENETSLLTMDGDEEMQDDPDLLHNCMKTLETPAAGDSGFGSQEFIDGKMMGVRKSEMKLGTGRGRARHFPKEKDTVTEDFINRQIQEVLCIQGEDGEKSWSSLTSSQKNSKTDGSIAIGVTKKVTMPDDMKRMMKPESRGRGKRSHK